jgi:hypothetical protein
VVVGAKTGSETQLTKRINEVALLGFFGTKGRRFKSSLLDQFLKSFNYEHKGSVPGAYSRDFLNIFFDKMLFILNDLGTEMSPCAKTNDSRVRMLEYTSEGERLRPS